MLATCPLDHRGLAYVRAHLANANPFCDALLAVVEAVPGEVFTVAPAGTSGFRLYGFEAGGWLPPVEGLGGPRAEQVMRSLREHPGAVCIVDDVGGAFDPEIATSFEAGGDAYFLLEARSARIEVEGALMLGDAGWHGVAALCAPPRTSRTALASPGALVACAATVIELTCTAYDGEGFVGWRRV